MNAGEVQMDTKLMQSMESLKVASMEHLEFATRPRVMWPVLESHGQILSIELLQQVNLSNNSHIFNREVGYVSKTE